MLALCISDRAVDRLCVAVITFFESAWLFTSNGYRYADVQAPAEYGFYRLESLSTSAAKLVCRLQFAGETNLYSVVKRGF